MVWWQRQFGGTTRGGVVALLRRGRRSVEEIARALGLTDNAVRVHLTTLERDGVVIVAGVRRERAAGKPATEYDIAPGADTLFSGAYAPVLAALVAELGAELPPARFDAVLRGAGRRLALAAGGPVADASAFEGRVRAAAALLADLGGEADLIARDGGYDIRAYGCPLARAVAARPETCRAVEQLLREVTGATVREHCDRDGAPHCRFAVPEPADAR